jgi:hypothetical protein
MMFRFMSRNVLWLTVVMPCAGTHGNEPGPTYKQLLQQAPALRAETGVSPAAEEVFLFHDRSDWQGKARILAITWFYRGQHSALQYFLNEDGYLRDWRQILKNSQRDVQASDERSLRAAELKSVKSLIADLPESKTEPPIELTVLVSFQSGDKWRTETYDAAALPDEFEKVMYIIGERFETKDRHKKKTD